MKKIKITKEEMDAMFRRRFFNDLFLLYEIPEDYIRSIKYMLSSYDWACICRWQKLSEEFIIEHSDYIHWRLIFKSQKLSKEFVSNFYYKLDY